jgi:acyl-CoA synthetase (AMP-forming)/AMP-acid ligase II
MPLYDLIAASAERFRHKTALVFSDQSITFGSLDLHARQVSANLRKLGIGPGARVAILHENALAGVIFFWGILGSGSQVVDVPSLAGIKTIETILAECKPAAIVISAHQLQRLMRAGVSLPGIVFMESPPAKRWGSSCYHFLTDIIRAERIDEELPQIHDSSVALIIYTSDSTGRPKGVMLSHRNLLSNINSANHRIGLTSDDSILVVIPLHLIHGRMQLLTHAKLGGTTVFSQGFKLPQKVLNELETYQVTGFWGTPQHFSTLLQRTDIARRRFPDLRYVLITGGAMQPEAVQSLAKALPGVEIHVEYGQTEASPRITYLGPLEVLDNPGSCGRPLPGVLVEIIAEDGSQLPQGMVGEIIVSGPNIMCGYVSEDEISCGKIDTFGRLHTGDIGKFDRHGLLRVLGRISTLINSGGERVFPGEVESVLEAHPAVRKSAVFGIPDLVLGEKIVACVVCKQDATVEIDELLTHCLRSLPQVRAPREIRFAQHLPKTESGKIDRRHIQEHFE